MAFGTLGSTLNDELNRLANGGTYRDMDDMVDEALAAKQWANRENIVPYSTDTVGILNEIAALGPNRQNWFDFNGVCNYLAGTTGLPAAAALRQITTTGDILTSLAAYYVDATAPTNWGSLGYVRLNGVSGNYLSVPDASNLDITGDIDIRIQAALDDWTPSSEVSLGGKWSTTNQYSYLLNVVSDGTIKLYWTTNGSTGTILSSTSTVATGITDGSTKWVRVTLDVDNGASGKNVKFYLSDDGTTWTQLGSTVTTAGTTSIFSGSANVEIGANTNGTASLWPGKFYRAQILNGIDGTTVLDVNIASNYTAASQSFFTATTGQTVTVNGVDTIANLGSAGSLLPTTLGSSTAADSNDPKFLDHTGTNYVYLPGVISNYLSVPDSAALDIIGDIDARWYGTLDDWSPAAPQAFVAKWTSTGNQRSYLMALTSAGQLQFYWTTDGSTLLSATSSAAITVADGSALWVRSTLDVDNGASGRDVKFFTSTDGTNWTQLGTTQTTAGVTSIYAGTGIVEIGSQSNTWNLAGKTYRAQIYSDITGTTKVLDVDTSVITAGSATSFTAVTGQTVTINRSTSGRKTVAVTQPTWLFGTDDYMEVNNRYMAHSTSDENYVYLSGASGNYMSVADNPPLDVTGDIDIQVKVALDDWTPSTGAYLVGKLTSASSQVSYAMRVSAAGNLIFLWSTNGTTLLTATSTVANTITDGATKWVRTTVDVDNGASGYDVKFWTSDDGTTWTQLGATVTGVGTTSLYSGTAVLEIGSGAVGTLQPAKGKFYRAIIKNGIDGTTVLDANAAVITLPSQTTFTDSSSNAYTVTINKSGVGTFVSTGNYLYLPGVASNYASAPDSAALDITGDIDLRVKLAMDDWTPSAESCLIAKWIGQLSYALTIDTNGRINILWTTNGSTTIRKTSTVSPTITDGSTLWVRATLDVDNGAAGNDVKFWTSNDGLTWTQLGTTVTTAGTTSIFSGTDVLEIGRISGPTNAYLARGKFFRAQVLNGIGGTVAFDANFESSITSLNQASFTESSSNAATVTINRSGSTYRSAGVIDAGYLYPGATNTFSNSTTDFLNFAANQSFTLFFVGRQWGTPASFGNYINKKDNATNQGSGYRFGAYGTGLQTFGSIADGTNVNPDRFAAVYTAGTLINTYGIADRTAQTFMVTQNSNSSATASLAAFGAISSPFQFSVGRSSQGTGYQDFELIGVAVFRTVLTATQIRQISNYFANREVYL